MPEKKLKQTPQIHRMVTYQSESKPVTDLQWGEKSSLLLCCQQRAPNAVSFGRERYKGFNSNWTNESNLWVLQINSYSQPKPPNTHTHTQREPRKVYESPIKQMTSYWADGISHSLEMRRWMGGWMEGIWGIRMFYSACAHLLICCFYLHHPISLTVLCVIYSL